jgi:UDP-GlcNAc3NAcA epimerase
MKIVTIIGARPQFIKAAAVSREIERNPEIKEIIIHTGQHFDEDMSGVFFQEMQIPTPNYNLEINSISHGAMTGRMLEKIECILLKEKPDFVMVYGDTNSTVAGALAAKKLHIKVIHIEAGLRSFNMQMPEEINRIITDRISDILCCPTNTAMINLQKEGLIADAQNSEFKRKEFDRFYPLVVQTGDVMLDVAEYYSQFSEKYSLVMNRLGLKDQEFILCTIHRAENTDNHARLMSIIEALNEISKQVKVVLPLHPRTRKILEKSFSQLLKSKNQTLEFISPVGYFDMVELLKHAKLVMTDSGGLQKEAFFFNKPCITLRDQTEWTELVDCGANQLVGAKKDKIINAFKIALSTKVNKAPIYGAGNASVKIIECIMQAYK